ncbi:MULTISPECIES: tyrosine-type recombinase/integrase [unclassified Actinomadura]|uniref:tyrosine-type recombinase/integrase n=1 Tax=unclassified Actinomadura TaxID=2626254 RepID=UPI001F1F51A8|nr:tyrosine-type recombinase/integrase [Actinomadura sp. K4S16]
MRDPHPAHASWLLNGGADLQVVKERLGHASIATTAHYPQSGPGSVRQNPQPLNRPATRPPYRLVDAGHNHAAAPSGHRSTRERHG